MKIVAGMGNMEDYELLAAAGADEIFTGYVPLYWNQKYGTLLPLNRREVMFYQVQAGTWEDMKILQRKIEKYHVPVTIAMNALYYHEEQRKEAAAIIQGLTEIGYHSFILADLTLAKYLQQQKIDCHIHLSGEIGEWNSKTISFLRQDMQVERIIFHRKNLISDMESCIQTSQKLGFAKTYEAFLLNELCHYTGGFCNSLHCDEMVHMCQMPYKLAKETESASLKVQTFGQELLEEQEDYEQSALGTSGCGLCALWKLKKAQITHLKIVGRGKSAESMAQDIQAVVRARTFLEEAETEKSYQEKMKTELWEGACPKNCYYREENEKQ